MSQFIRPFLPPADIADHSSKAGADQLAQRIQAFWLALGHTMPECRVESLGRCLSEHTPFYGVRSNLGAGGGLPPAGKAK